MATEINIKNIPTGYQSIISNGRHAVIGDEPIKAKGTDLGFSPVEFILAGISMCKVATIRNVARRKGWEIGNVDAQLSQNVLRNSDGSLKTRVKSNIQIEGDITEEQRALLISEADNCYVTRMVRGEWELHESETLKLEVETATL
ncbi:MAG: OsmC family protein [Flavobacteriales bacterium]|nr:OsmC family protein [Flavobacteriales bacterium]